MAKWQGSGLIWPRRYLFVGVGDMSDLHATHAIVICVSLEMGKRCRLWTDEPWKKSYQAAIIAPDVKHAKICSEAGVIILLYLMPETNEAYQIRDEYLHGSRIVEVSPNVLDALLPQLSDYRLDRYRKIGNLDDKQAEALCKELDCDQGEALCQKVISALGIRPSTELSKELSPTVKAAIEVMDEKVRNGARATELKVEEIAREVAHKLNLDRTPSNLGEVFVDEVDVTMGHYKVGLRLREALTEMNPETRLRRLAQKIRLSGGPALSHVFYDWLGVSPSEISHHSYFRRCQG
jgi:hypothetical protein